MGSRIIVSGGFSRIRRALGEPVDLLREGVPLSRTENLGEIFKK